MGREWRKGSKYSLLPDGVAVKQGDIFNEQIHHPTNLTLNIT